MGDYEVIKVIYVAERLVNIVAKKGVLMRSDLIGKIEKAHRYAGERDRITIRDFNVNFRGDHGTYATSYYGEEWHCACNFFAKWETCSHVMALQKILGNMLPEEARSSFE